MFNLFKKEKTASLVPPIKDQIWMIKEEDGSPWLREDTGRVTIIDCQEGWVRYKYGDYVFSDERMKLDLFLKVFTPVKMQDHVNNKGGQK